jgi:hypothetical protein
MKSYLLLMKITIRLQRVKAASEITFVSLDSATQQTEKNSNTRKQ